MAIFLGTILTKTMTIFMPKSFVLFILSPGNRLAVTRSAIVTTVCACVSCEMAKKCLNMSTCVLVSLNGGAHIHAVKSLHVVGLLLPFSIFFFFMSRHNHHHPGRYPGCGCVCVLVYLPGMSVIYTQSSNRVCHLRGTRNLHYKIGK